MLGKLRWLNCKTIYFNFKYFSFKDALKFPVHISRKVCLLTTKGKIKIDTELKSGMIEIGFGDIGIFDKKHSRTVWEVNGEVEFRGNAKIGHGSKISVGKDGKLILGKNFNITAESTLVAFKKIETGDNCLLSWDILIMDTDFHKIRDAENKIINPDTEVIIGNNVWIGCRSLILKGCVIPDNSIISANSLVNKNLTGENNIFGGTPLRILKENVKWNY